MDMFVREIELLRTSFENLKKYYTKNQYILNAEIEEIAIMIEEVKATVDHFIQKVIVDGVDELTKRIPSQAVTRFFDEWLKKAEDVSSKIHLGSATFKLHYKRMSQQLQDKMDLGESLRPVDIDYQGILVQEETKRLAAKIRDLDLLKKDTTSTARDFTFNKDRLNEQVATLARVQAKIKEKEHIIDQMTAEIDKVQVEIEKAEESLESIVELRAEYTVPDVLEYVKLKQRSDRLKKDMTNWERHHTLQHRELLAAKKKVRDMNLAHLEMLKQIEEDSGEEIGGFLRF